MCAGCYYGKGVQVLASWNGIGLDPPSHSRHVYLPLSKGSISHYRLFIRFATIALCCYVLSSTGVNYSIVRPTGLNDNWPAGSRPLFSQGDVAVGRIHRKDVAKVLVDVLVTPEACDKTFEVLALAGYPPARSIAPALERLVTDAQGLTEAQLEMNFSLLQQLLPGEVQDAAKLAMGQTYEELDQGKTGRLGERGTEDAEAAAPKPTSSLTV